MNSMGEKVGLVGLYVGYQVFNLTREFRVPRRRHKVLDGDFSKRLENP